MKRVLTKLLAGLLPAVCVMASPYARANGPVTVLTNLTVTSNAMPNLPGWSIGGKILSVQPTTPPVSGDAPYALEAQYPAVGATGMGGPWANFSVASLNTESIYIDFWAKMPDAKEGLKFCKIFGVSSGTSPSGAPYQGYANTTIGTDFTGVSQGGFVMIGYGDGTSLDNDTQDIIRLTGQAQTIGISAHQSNPINDAIVLTPQMKYFTGADWGTGWHHFRIHVKFNTNTTGEPNGAIYFQIDNKVYANVTHLANRNPANGPIRDIGLFGWAQSDPQPFDIWYDNVVISTGGWATGLQSTSVQRPAQMTSVSVQ
jgi:hypothetical protein